MTQAYPGYPPQPTAPTYPQQPQQWPAQQQQAPAYPPQQQWPAQVPQAPQYGAPPMQYPAPQPGPALAQGSIDDFFNQPSAGGGKSLAFNVGTRFIGIVTRSLGNGDIQQQTDRSGQPQFFKDGRPKFVMKVPLQMQPSPEYPDGLATWFVKGQSRDELARAMAEAGAPEGAPEHGAVIDVACTGERPIQGYSAAKQYRVVYTRPQGAAPVQQAPAAAPAQPPAAPVQQPVPAPPVQQYAPPPQVQQAPPSAPAPQVPLQAPADLSPDQQALLARLTNAPQ